MALSKKWAGSVYGTNTGNLFIELDDPANVDHLVGTLRFMDNQFGLVVYRLSGSFADSLKFTGEVLQGPQGLEFGVIDAEAKLTSEGHLRGAWKTSLGTAGTFIAYPHDEGAVTQVLSDSALVPEQVFSSTIQLGALRLYADGIENLARSISMDFLEAKPIVTYSIRGSEVTRYFDDFKKDFQDLGKLFRFKFHIQQPEVHGILKMVTVDLNNFGKNEIRVQGVNETWVVGKAEATARLLHSSESSVLTNYKKFGLTFNQFIFFCMLIAMPAINTLFDRATFVIAVVLLLNILYWLHTQFIPIAVVNLANAKPTIFERIWPSFLSWFIALTSGVAASWLFALMSGK